MKYSEVKSWVENEGIVSTVQCNRVISHGSDDPPPPMPMQRSFSEMDLREYEIVQEPARPPTKKMTVELSPHLDIEFEQKKSKPKVELVPNHIFQYFVKHMYHAGALNGGERAASKPRRTAQLEVKKFNGQAAYQSPPLSQFSVQQRTQVVPQQQQVQQHQVSRKTQSEVHWAPGTVEPSSRSTFVRQRRMVDTTVPKHWWQYNHPGKLVGDSEEYASTSNYGGYNSGVQEAIEKRYVVDQVEQNPIYAQVTRRGVLRNSANRGSAMSYEAAPSWIDEYSYPSPYVTANAGGVYNSGASDIVVTGRNTHMVG